MSEGQSLNATPDAGLDDVQLREAVQFALEQARTHGASVHRLWHNVETTNGHNRTDSMDGFFSGAWHPSEGHGMHAYYQASRYTPWDTSDPVLP